MKIRIKESQDNSLLSQTEHVYEMLDKLTYMIADIREKSGMWGIESCALDLINFRNGVDSFINELAVAKA